MDALIFPPFKQLDSFLSLVFGDQISFFHAWLTCSKPVDSKHKTWFFLVLSISIFLLCSVFGYLSFFLILVYEVFFFFLKTVGAWNSNLEGRDGKKTQNYARVNIDRLGLMKALGHLQSFFAMNDTG